MPAVRIWNVMVIIPPLTQKAGRSVVVVGDDDDASKLTCKGQMFCSEPGIRKKRTKKKEAARITIRL